MSFSSRTLEQLDTQRRVFNALDKDQKGFLTVVDILNGMNVLVKGADVAQLALSFEHADKDHDGRLTFQEFVDLTGLHAVSSGISSLSVNATSSPSHITGNLFAITSGETVPPPIPITAPATAAPVLLVPGLAGSVLNNAPNTNTVRRWVELTNVISQAFLQNLGADWVKPNVVNKRTNIITQDRYNVSYLGGVDGVKSLIAGVANQFNYMKFLVDALKLPGVNAVPYDWRLVPQQAQMTQWVADTKKALLALHTAAGRKVVILGHSMGNLMVQYFFSTERAFAEEHIAAYFAVAPPYGGAGIAVNAVINGFKFPLGESGDLEVPATFVRAFPAIAWLFPRTSAFGDTAVFKKGTETYNAAQFPGSLNTTDTKDTFEIYTEIVSKIESYLPVQPPVPVYLFTSSVAANATPIGMDNTQTPPGFILEDGNHGDGVVPYASLHAHDTLWSIPEANKFVIPNTDHSSIVESDVFIQQVVDIISALPQ